MFVCKKHEELKEADGDLWETLDPMEHGAKGTACRICICICCIVDDPITTNHNRCSLVRLVDD